MNISFNAKLFILILQGAYSRMHPGVFCDGVAKEIHTKKECERAANILDLSFDPVVVDDPFSFPRCYFINSENGENMVAYNKNSDSKREFKELPKKQQESYLAVCKPGNSSSRFRIEIICA